MKPHGRPYSKIFNNEQVRQTGALPSGAHELLSSFYGNNAVGRYRLH